MIKTLTKYVEEQYRLLKFTTLRRRVSSLRRVNILLGHSDLIFGDEFRIAWRRIKRRETMVPRQAQGINQNLLISMIDVQPNSPIDIRNRALLSLGYDFLARRSEITALSTDDVQFLPDGSLRGIIRKSKTEPYGRERLVFGSKRSARLLKPWLELKPKEIAPLFCPIEHGRLKYRALSDRSVNAIIKKVVIKAHEHRPNDRAISSHSLRVEAAQDLLIIGYDHIAIMPAGGWTSANPAQNYLKLAEHNVWE
jgi:integrase/recombinase XerD